MRQDTLESFEVIVVDNGSWDRTRSVALRYKNRLQLRVLSEPRRTRGAARARGCAAARGQIIFSTDADAELPANWLRTYSAALRRKNAVAVGGSCVINDCTPLTNFMFNLYQPLSFRVMRMFRCIVLRGANFAVTRQAYAASGGFQPDFDAMEDVDFSNRVRTVGKLLYIAQPKVLVSGRRYQGGLLRGVWQHLSTFIDAILLKKKNVTLSCA